MATTPMPTEKSRDYFVVSYGEQPIMTLLTLAYSSAGSPAQSMFSARICRPSFGLVFPKNGSINSGTGLIISQLTVLGF